MTDKQPGWSELADNERQVLMVVALAGGSIPDRDLLDDLSNFQIRPLGRDSHMMGASLLRLSQRLGHFLRYRAGLLEATPALRKVAWLDPLAKPMAAKLLSDLLSRSHMTHRWRSPRINISIAVCGLLCGHPWKLEMLGMGAYEIEMDALCWMIVEDDPELLQRLPEESRGNWAVSRYHQAFSELEPDLPQWRERVFNYCRLDEVNSFLQELMLEDLLRQGDLPPLTRQLPTYLAEAYQAGAQCLRSADLAHLSVLDKAHKISDGGSTPTPGFPGMLGVLQWLLHFADGRQLSQRRLAGWCKIERGQESSEDGLLRWRLGQLCESWARGQQMDAQEPTDPLDALAWWAELVLAYWRGAPISASLLQAAGLAEQHARKLHWDRLADQLQAAIERISGQKADGDRRFVIDLKQSEAPWERTLATLEALAQSATAVASSNSPGRLLLTVKTSPKFYGEFELSLHEQPRTRTGKLGKARTLNRVLSISKAQALWPADSQQALILRSALADLARGGQRDFGFSISQNDSQTLKAVLGYPDIEDDKGKPLRLEEGKLKISVSSGNNGEVLLKCEPRLDPLRAVSWLHKNKVWYRYEPNEKQRLLLGLLSEPQELPANALQRFAKAAESLSPWAELHLDLDQQATAIAADPITHLLLELNDGELLVQPRARPLGREQGPYVSPGHGAPSILGTINGLPAVAKRDLQAERAALAQTLQQLDLPAELVDEEEPAIAFSADVALDFLARLEERPGERVLAWPKGKAQRVLRGKSLKTEINSGRDWIGVNGDLLLADGSTLALNKLLGLIRQGESRFVQLDHDRLLLLDRDLRKRLEALQPLADGRGEVKLNKLAAPALAQALGAEAEHSGVLVAELGKRAAAFAQRPALPSDVQAELRDYQLDGYHWLMRMAAWGAGACLADDMGLGKTVQTLALLCARAAAGPALVVAPTSVLGNWAQEARRFAPGLNVHRYEQCDRDKLLAAVGTFDLLLISYSLMALDGEKLATVCFATLVLDEAQAIKNAATQRAQSACALQADYRVALTGTPIENHLGELWSLLRFLNPGLLGSAQHFQQRFQGPIERGGDAALAPRAALRQLIGGFVLRRTKAQVLEELPPRTEITLRVEPGEEQARLQQAMRLQALERLDQGGDQSVGARRFNILAELTRLRRAACHPQLYSKEIQAPSAKLDQLVELLLELRENRHRALVFSQFVDFLTLARAALEAAGLSYQYLDGSTVAKRRDAAVAAFQRGDGDCFLLSLKAGGSGLNLTAADYVIHLDPWWNPAVEQQASDRAHRIGQTRPVTVYRLVLADSIEERILALHGAKRELMDSVLAESDGGMRLSEEDLLALIG